MKSSRPVFILNIVLVSGFVGLFACSRPTGDAQPTLAPTASLAQALPTTAATRSSPQTRTPVPSTTTPQPTATPCQYALQPALAGAWNPDELGCPITPGAAAVNTAYAPFEGGQMLWRGDTDVIYVLTGDGRWTSYSNEWREGDPEYTCGEEDPLTTPIRGFGRVWCDHPAVREALGAITAAEIGDSSSTIQDFVNGTILIAPFDDPFVLVGENGLWRRIEE